MNVDDLAARAVTSLRSELGDAYEKLGEEGKALIARVGLRVAAIHGLQALGQPVDEQGLREADSQLSSLASEAVARIRIAFWRFFLDAVADVGEVMRALLTGFVQSAVKSVSP